MKRKQKHKRTRTEFTLPNDLTNLSKMRSEVPTHEAKVLTLVPKYSKNMTLKKTTSAQTSIKRARSFKRNTSLMPISETYGVSMQATELVKRPSLISRTKSIEMAMNDIDGDCR